jgi:tRNA pseudouridine32 synthase/23S rRNA pseudouridine746 synthase
MKPPNLLPTPGKHTKDCVVARLKSQLGAGFVAAPHRLDMQTSGVMVLCLDQDSLSDIGKQFEQGLVQKTYIAAVHGTLPQTEGVINFPIRGSQLRPLQIVCEELGKASLTQWRVLDEREGLSIVELKPLTGRTHQLRVHLAAVGAPILGDTLYAHDEAYSQSAGWMKLHATELVLQHPHTSEQMVFTAPCPFWDMSE